MRFETDDAFRQPRQLAPCGRLQRLREATNTSHRTTPNHLTGVGEVLRKREFVGGIVAFQSYSDCCSNWLRRVFIVIPLTPAVFRYAHGSPGGFLVVLGDCEAPERTISGKGPISRLLHLEQTLRTALRILQIQVIKMKPIASTFANDDCVF